MKKRVFKKGGMAVSQLLIIIKVAATAKNWNSQFTMKCDS